MTEAQRSTALFVISNFNTDPGPYLEYCTDSVIYDQSTDAAMKKHVLATYPSAVEAPHTGHNISDYCRAVVERWGDLPETMMWLKGNMVGRHVTQKYFDRVYGNTKYTLLYNDPTYQPMPGVSSMLSEAGFLERNNSWYADIKSHRYFATYDQLLDFLYVRPMHPEWLLFAPGACHIVPRANLARLPRDLFRALSFISSYEFFPAEAYFVERVLNTVLTCDMELQPYLADYDRFREALDGLPDRTDDRLPTPSVANRLRRRAVRGSGGSTG